MRLYMLVSCCDNADGSLAWSWARDTLKAEIDKKKLRSEALALAREELRREQAAANTDGMDEL